MSACDGSQRLQTQSKMASGSRRRFIKAVAAGIAVGGESAHMTAASYAKVRGANDRVRVGVIGVRGMGYGHVRAYAAIPNLEVAAICDVDENVLEARRREMESASMPKPQTFVDLRKM